MLISEFEKAYKPSHQCKVFYINGFNMTVSGIALTGIVRESSKKPHVCIDSMQCKIPLTKIIKVEPTEISWPT